MDESTSALDTANEALLYAALRRAGVTYVSVGHRPTLLRFHERVLLLAGSGSGGGGGGCDDGDGSGNGEGGGWELRRAEEVSLEAAVDVMG